MIRRNCTFFLLFFLVAPHAWCQDASDNQRTIPSIDAIDKAIGKVIAVVHTKDAPFGTEPLKDYGFNKAGFNVLARHFGALMRGQLKDNPLFEEGAPVVAPRVLSKAERKAATP